MTQREKAICELVTGVCFCEGDQREAVYKYVSELLGRPVYTHEFPAMYEKLKELAMPDFMTMCKEENPLEAMRGSKGSNHEADYIARSAAVAIADYAADEHPYDKDPEKPETFSEYNQGWNDACDYIRDKLEGAQAADTSPNDNGMKTMRLIDSDKLIEALDEYGMLSLQSDIMPGPERVYNVVRSAPIVDAVPRDYHKRRLELVVKAREKAEKKQKLTEATNRQIIENYVPVVGVRTVNFTICVM